MSITRENRKRIREELRQERSPHRLVVPQVGITTPDGRTHFVVRAD